MLAHYDGEHVRLISRRGLDWDWRFPPVVAAVRALAVRTCIIDRELIACDANGLARLLSGCQPLALVLNRVFDDPGPVVFEHACKLGCEGIVSKRRGSRYARGRTYDWLTVKNPNAPAVRREAEQDWSG
jgi:ATP-dependent DNA ligase